MAQDFPVKPVRMVVPFAAGTTTDIVARAVAEGMARQLGQSVVVENRAGAGGGIGSDLVAKSPADGYTILMGTVGTHAINATLFKKLAYDPQRDFAPVAFAGYTPTLLVVSGASPVKSLKDLADLARRPDGRVSFASAGNGTSGHLALQGRRPGAVRCHGWAGAVHVLPPRRRAAAHQERQVARPRRLERQAQPCGARGARHCGGWPRL
jgi:tripartite-type tricarboxylate transporter receptor subunit TctC